MKRKQNAYQKKKKKTKAPSDTDLLDDILGELEDDGAQLLGSEGLSLKIRGVISTQDPAVDMAIGRGGIPLGRLTVLHGKEGCLVGSTLVNLNRAGKGFSCTIRHLNKMFNGGEAGGKKWSKDIPTTIRAMVDDGTIRLIQVKNVWYAGEKVVYEVKTKSGHILRATSEHKFLTVDGWKKCSELKIGEKLYVEICKRPVKKKKKKKAKYVIRQLKNHPYANGKKSERFGVPHHRLVFEAYMNGLSVDEFIQKIRDNRITGFKFLDPAIWVIHHKDEDTQNNDLFNLQKLTYQEHREIHSQHAKNNISVFPKRSQIVSMRVVSKQAVYDIETDKPNNYLANGIVVHNSGKTTLALHIVAECQKQDGIVIYIDHEYKLDPDYAKAIGVNTKKLVIAQPPYLEKVFMMIEKAIQKVADKRIKTGVRVPVLIVHDSINAAITKAEFEGEYEAHHVAPSARVYSSLLPKIMPLVSKEDVALLFISQMRKKIGVMFGDPSEIAGGSAVKHWASLIGRITKIGTVKDTVEGEKGGSKVANKVTVEWIKNQISPPFKKATCQIVYGKGFSKENSLIELALKKKVIRKKKNTFLTVKENKKLGGSLKATIQTLKDSPKVYETILKRVEKV